MTQSDPRFYVPKPAGGLFGAKWAYGQSFRAEYTVDGMTRCPTCGRNVGLMRWRQPHRITISRSDPSRWPDILFGPDMSDLMVSAYLRHLYEQHGLSGVPHFAPAAEVVRAGRKRAEDLPHIPAYHNVKFDLLRTEIDVEASGYVLAERPTDAAPECPTCHQSRRILRRHGYRIQLATWHGEDVFGVTWGPKVMVSQRFVDVCTTNAVRGVDFVPAETDAIDFTVAPGQ